MGDSKPVKVGALVVGNEILLGRTRDTNTIFLAEQLLRRGLKLRRWIIVPDMEGEISKEMGRFIMDDFDIIVISGGMGPTHDDITVEAVGRALGISIDPNKECYDRMYKKWQWRNPGKELPGSVKTALRKMARVPKDFDLINNEEGMVEGLVGTANNGNNVIFILPGVPREYRGIVGTSRFQDHLPSGYGGGIDIIEIPFKGRESRIAPPLVKIQGRYPDIDIGSYPQGPERVILRLTGDPDTIRKAEIELRGVCRELEPKDGK
ncbi:MAG: molybdopterin-binding protein [Candidatus Thermoplasmatota archaeon]|nr:molybdopterin-binding protein [Candidatus Thermoplasmatota archaeon]